VRNQHHGLLPGDDRLRQRGAEFQDVTAPVVGKGPDIKTGS